MSGGWKAYIEDTAEGWATNTVRLWIAQPRGDHVDILNGDGTITVHPEGVAVEGGIVLPRDAVDPLVEAIRRWQGSSGDPATEVRVLREWLADERRRVDALVLPAPSEPRTR